MKSEREIIIEIQSEIAKIKLNNLYLESEIKHNKIKEKSLKREYLLYKNCNDMMRDALNLKKSTCMATKAGAF